MIIINYFLHLTSLSYKQFRSCWTRADTSQDSRRGERTSLLGTEDIADQQELTTAPSLTSEFEDFAHSWNAWRVCLIHAVLYYAAAVLGFSFLVERWPVIDSLYFGTVVFTTIGFGDLSPSTEAGRFYVIGLACYGILILGIFLGIAGA